LSVDFPCNLVYNCAMGAKLSTPEPIRTAVRIHLLRRGLKIVDLAARLGMHRVYLTKVLDGERRGSPTRKRLIEECGIPASLLRFRKRKPASPSPDAHGPILKALEEQGICESDLSLQPTGEQPQVLDTPEGVAS
jgi:hypothetical protein